MALKPVGAKLKTTRSPWGMQTLSYTPILHRPPLPSKWHPDPVCHFVTIHDFQDRHRPTDRWDRWQLNSISTYAPCINREQRANNLQAKTVIFWTESILVFCIFEPLIFWGFSILV